MQRPLTVTAFLWEVQERETRRDWKAGSRLPGAGEGGWEGLLMATGLFLG